MENLRAKTCLITGATLGIGRATADALALMGARLVLLVRDAKRGEAVAQEIRAKSGNTDVELLLCDLASLAQVRAAAAAFKAKHDRLHVLINNAGALFIKRQETADGFECSFGVNHLAPFLLTNLLLDTIKASAPARIINVSSAVHWRARLDFDDLQTRRGYGGFRAYGRSKLANILFTIALAERLKGTGVTVNAVHPGAVSSGFGKNNPVHAVFFKLIAPFLISPVKGAATSIYLASSPEVEGVSGKYFARCKPARTSRAARDRDAAERLWQVSERLTGL